MDYLTDRRARLSIAECCRDPGRRFVGHWQGGHNSKWHPESVKRPDGSGDLFSDPEAWEFIAQLIEDHHALRVIELRTPTGAKGYELIIQSESGLPDIYIKLALTKTGKVVGRSFHYSDR